MTTSAHGLEGAQTCSSVSSSRPGPVEGLRGRGQTVPVCPLITPPDRWGRLLVDQACQQQRDEHGIGDVLMTTLFLITDVLFGPAVEGANIAATA